jgi:hypothetical protein
MRAIGDLAWRIAGTQERFGLTMPNIRRLDSLWQLPAPLLTAYLETGPAEASHHGPVPAYLTWLKKEAKSIAEGVPRSEQDLFEEQLRRVEGFVRERAWAGKNLVIFAGSATWEVVPVRVEIENELHWGKPALTQWLWLLSENKPHCVVVVDRTGARFFRYWLGEMAELAETKFEIDISQWKKKELGHVVGQDVQKTRGSQRDTYEHRMDAQYRRLFDETAGRTKNLCEKEGLAAIFLVGSERLVEPIRAELPGEFQQRVVLIKEDLARLPPIELQQHLEPEIGDWGRKRQSALVNALLADGPGGVVGIDETLAQIQKGTARTVIVAKDLDADLRQCSRCAWTDRSADPACAACGGERRGITLREVLPELARRSKVDIEVVSGEAGERLKEAGGMAAWLRQPKPAELSRAASRAK